MNGETLDYRALIKKVERVVEAIDRSPEATDTIHTVALAILNAFRDELGLSGARLYQRVGTNYVLQATMGDARALPSGLEIPQEYPPILAVLESGTVCMDADDPGVDAGLERTLGVERFAALELASEEYVLAFDVGMREHRDDVLYSLGILRHAINQKVRQEKVEGIFRQARKIQASILPRRIPTFGVFDLAGRTEPMEQVGGDFYDFVPVTDKILGLAIADVSGHGLPAALQVRDIYMGLRMGMARDFKIVRTVERMNNIIHQSTLTNRFVSMFYGELELNGVFIFVNAGHPPPFHLAADGKMTRLEAGGPVLGPLPDTAYERGFVTQGPGDLIVFYTDGIVEAESRSRAGSWPEEFGEERLVEVVRAVRERPAAEIVAAIFDAVEKWGGGRSAKDDRTVMVARYPAD